MPQMFTVFGKKDSEQNSDASSCPMVRCVAASAFLPEELIEKQL
jgi:hypothetical protein